LNQQASSRFSIRRSFDASDEKVFDAWLIPYLAGSWVFGPDADAREIIQLQNEPRPGGNFLFVARQFGKEQTITGEYAEIRRPEKLVCSWGVNGDDPSLCRLSIEIYVEDSRTRMHLTQEMDAALSSKVDDYKAAWKTRLKALATLVEKPPQQQALFR